MNEDERQIEILIRDWARAVHEGDMAVVLRDHADDIVMFDVPPPENGVRGIGEYRESWPPFFEWQATEGSFEIVELDVTAGEDVAWAFALVICSGIEEREKNPDRRLRLTIGLQKRDGRWSVSHEHHSYTNA